MTRHGPDTPSAQPTLDPVRLCAALADDSRWRILEVLGETERSASELAEVMPISRQAIARHLQQLEFVGLVTPVREGRQIRYRALGAQLGALATHLETIGRGWEARLGALQHIAESANQAHD